MIENPRLTAEDIADLQAKHGYTTRKFAAIVGVRESTVRNWKNGTSRPMRDTSARILSRFGKPSRFDGEMEALTMSFAGKQISYAFVGPEDEIRGKGKEMVDKLINDAAQDHQQEKA